MPHLSLPHSCSQDLYRHFSRVAVCRYQKHTIPTYNSHAQAKIFILLNMSFPFPRHRRKASGDRQDSGLATLSAGFSLTLPLPSPPLRLTKVLVNVTIENSLGPVQVLISPDETVADLIKTALAIYDREKRRPFLKLKDPKHYALHYSPFWLQSLKGNDKLRNLGSRNFFLCNSKPSTISSCSEEANMSKDFAFPLMVFVHLPL